MPFNLITASSFGVIDTHNSLPLPNSKTVDETSSEELRSIFDRLGIDRAHSRPRNELLADYERLLKRIGDEASAKAIDAFLKSKRD